MKDDDDKFKPRRRRDREERLEERRKAREARKLVNRRELEKRQEAGEFMVFTACIFCGEKMEIAEAIHVGGFQDACADCIKSYGKEIIEGYVAAHPEGFRGLEWCYGCDKQQEANDFSPFWTGKTYRAVCKTCKKNCGETELRDKLAKHRSSGPIMDGGLPTLGKNR